MEEQKMFARGYPKICEITETYSYGQEISRNPIKQPTDPPYGEIEVVVPYDGSQHFSRDAYKDILKQEDNISHGNEALIGHLLLTDFSRVDIEGISDFIDHHDTIPVKVPVSKDEIPLHQLLNSDCYSAKIKHRYIPQQPEVIPINVDMKLYDEDQLITDPQALQERLLDVTKEITHQVKFKRHLFLEFNVTIDIPTSLAPEDLKPQIRFMSMTWPTVTSFQMLDLKVGSQSVPVSYNSVSRCLEWEDVQLKKIHQLSGVNLTRFGSPSMFLAIRQPGELYRQEQFETRVELELPGLLLSGMKVRLFNAEGKYRHHRRPRVLSRVIGVSEMILGDAFALRTFFPCMHLHFDEVIPDDMRLANIMTALSDRDFEKVFDSKLDSVAGEYRHFIFSRRQEGPNLMYFWITVEGKRFFTERQVQEGGQTFTSKLESGYLKIFIKGALKGDSPSLIREMNMIQSTLHDRFERIKAKF